MVKHFYEFGDYSLYPAVRELRYRDEPISISARALDCIVYLIERRDRAVGRDELIAAVWGKTDIADTQLNTMLFKARRAIAFGYEAQDAIRTVQGFGYRWIVAVQIRHAGAITDALNSPALTASYGNLTSDALQVLPYTKVTTRANRRLFGIGATLIATIFVLGACIRFLQWSSPEPIETRAPLPVSALSAPGVPPNVDLSAVLPAEVVADKDWMWLRLGMMDLVANVLRRAGLVVVPSSNIAALGHDDAPADAIADAVRGATGAELMIQPSVLKLDSAWTVRLRWRRAERSGDVEAHATDPIAASREAANRLAVALGKSSVGVTSPESRRSDNSAAWYAQVDAALLADDVDTARKLVQSPPAIERGASELGLREGRIDLVEGRLGEARQKLQSLLPSLSAENQPLTRARVLLELGRAMVGQSDGAHAESVVKEALSLFEAQSNPDLAAQAFNGLGAAHALMGREESAIDDFAHARVTFKIAGNALGLAQVQYNESLLYLINNRPAEALPLLEDATKRYVSVGDYNSLADVQYCLVNTRLQLLQRAEALADTSRAMMSLDRIGDSERRQKVEFQRARSLAANGQLAEAGMLFEKLGPSSATSWRNRGLVVEAKIQLEERRPERALPLAREAAATLLSTDSDEEAYRAYAWLTEVRALRALGQYADAAAEDGAFMHWANGHSEPAVEIVVNLAKAERAWSNNEFVAAGTFYRAALGEARHIDSIAFVAEVAESYAGRLIAADRLDDATAVVGQVIPLAQQDFLCALLQVRLYQALGQRGAWEAALKRARALAGERQIPVDLQGFRRGHFDKAVAALRAGIERKRDIYQK